MTMVNCHTMEEDDFKDVISILFLLVASLPWKDYE